MFGQKTIEAVWSLTRPQDKDLSGAYREALSVVTGMESWDRYYPFKVPKKGGGQRLIFAAGEPQKIVQSCLAGWIVTRFSRQLGDDYCYLGGRGVLKAVQVHQNANSALVFDLENAFESIKSEWVKRRLRLFLPKTEMATIDLIVDLLTVQGRARQGCVSTPYVYNLMIKPLDDQLKLLLKQFFFNTYTRYSDNICFSTPSRRAPLSELEKQVERLVRGNGFTISWSKMFRPGEPIIYLGTKIHQGRISLEPDKYGEFCFRVTEALRSPNPYHYQQEMIGIFNWAHHICGDNVPGDLLNLLCSYFQRMDKVPPALTELMARQRTVKLC